MHQPAETPEQIVDWRTRSLMKRPRRCWAWWSRLLGPETFRAGVNAYVEKHAYANATAKDFWDAQTRNFREPSHELHADFCRTVGIAARGSRLRVFRQF